MASFTYLTNSNLTDRDIPTLIERGIPYVTEFPKSECAKLTVDDMYKPVLTEFRYRSYLEVKDVIGFQIYGNGNNYFGHNSDEVITCAKNASELLYKARKERRELPWHEKIIEKSDKVYKPV